MSDESDAVSKRERGYTSAFSAFAIPAARALKVARFLRSTSRSSRVTFPLLPLLFYAIAVQGLLIARHTRFWNYFWLEVVVLLALSMWPLVGFALERSNARNLQMHKGIQALRQVAVSGDRRLSPQRADLAQSNLNDQGTDIPYSQTITLGPLRHIYAGTGAIVGAVGCALLLLAILMGIGGSALLPHLNMFVVQVYFGLTIFFAVAGLLYILIWFQWSRAFTAVANEDGVSWRQPAFRVGWRRIQGPWREVRALVTFRARRDGKSADIDEVFLLDTTTEALAWRITPKTPASVRAAHEQFVRMANEHVQLRDITTSLKNLLESPETRSYEYAVIALSGPAPVPPAVRKVLTMPVRESHFLRGYLIVAAILLALLVAAGLVLQSGLVPAGAF
jgi:hypothetical protein